MAIHVTCPNCGREFEAADSDAGRKGQCANCGQVIEIPFADVGAAPDVQPVEHDAAGLPARMVANRAIAGHVCPSCGTEIFLGQRIRNCEACGETLHESCWESNGGCSTPGCSNAPLPGIQQDAGTATPSGEIAATAMAGQKPCKFCGEPIQASAKKCRHCGEFQSTTARRHRMPPRTCGAATASLVLGIVSFFCIGIITGPLAMIYGSKAKREIEAGRGRLTGGGMATAGFILGAIGGLLSVGWIIIRFGRIR